MRSIEIVPLLSEKSQKEREKGKYVFFCPVSTTKSELKELVEKIFNVKVEKINTMIYRGKIKRRGLFIGKRPNRKKVVVSLKKGYSIDLAKMTQKLSETMAKK